MQMVALLISHWYAGWCLQAATKMHVTASGLCCICSCWHPHVLLSSSIIELPYKANLVVGKGEAEVSTPASQTTLDFSQKSMQCRHS